jgi:hypothetical protein
LYYINIPIKQTSKQMDIFDRNQPRRLALAEAIKKAEYALQETEEYYRLQILKEQQKMLPNNQGYTMSDISWERAKQLGKEELAQHRERIDKENEADWEHNERKYAMFCRVHSLETF